MCGIFGGTIDIESTKKSIEKIRRGNDGIKIVTPKSNFNIAFQRHSVIAPEDDKSMQPIVSEDGRYYLIFNGEIFNYKEIRDELISKEYSFKSKGDAEVLLKLFIEKGLSFCDELDSMFAGVIYDSVEEKVIVFRDWIGEIPIHYILDQGNKKFIFSSEIKALVQTNHFEVSDIKTLEPGTIIELNLNSFSKSTYKYYSLELDNRHSGSNLEEIAVGLRDVLEKSAHSRLISDVPVCSLVSGGIDSAVTTYLINNLLKKEGKDLHTYCFHVEDNPIDEKSDLFYARKLVKYLGIENNFTELIIKPEDIVNSLPDVIYSLEDIRSKDFNVYTSIYNWFISKKIYKDGFKVAFNGEGSDEFFGSYGSWGSFQILSNDIIDNNFRIKMANNLYKGVLMRTSKVMMNAGPVEMRSLFLSRNVAEYIVNIPKNMLREGSVWKKPLAESFKDVLPSDIINRPKERPQDSTGIMNLKKNILDNYQEYGSNEKEIFSNILKEKIESN